MSDRPIAPTIEGRHRAGDHRYTSVTQCPLCQQEEALDHLGGYHDGYPSSSCTGCEYERLDREREEAIARAGEGKQIGCLFPDTHDPRHPMDMAFQVNLGNDTGWTNMTEQEIVRGLNRFGGRLSVVHGSQFSFWWEGWD